MVPTDNMIYVPSFRYKRHNSEIVINHKLNTCDGSSVPSARVYDVRQRETPSVIVAFSSVSKASTR
jgi:hypothetical protein